MRIQRLLILLLIVSLLAGCGGNRQKQFDGSLWPGQRLTIILAEEVGTHISSPGDRIYGYLNKSVVVSQALAIVSGTLVEGEIVESLQGIENNPSHISIRFDRIELTNGDMIPLDCQISHNFVNAPLINVLQGPPPDPSMRRVPGSYMTNNPFYGKQEENLYIMSNRDSDVIVAKGTVFVLTLGQRLVVKPGYKGGYYQ